MIGREDRRTNLKVIPSNSHCQFTFLPFRLINLLPPPGFLCKMLHGIAYHVRDEDARIARRDIRGGQEMGLTCDAFV